MQIDEFERFTSVEQVEDELMRMEIIALQYWMRYEAVMNHDPKATLDEYERRMWAIKNAHQRRQQEIAQRKAA